MTGWDWSLLIYAGLFAALDLLAWWVGRGGGRIKVLDHSVSRKSCHQFSECFAAMPDKILLFDLTDE